MTRPLRVLHVGNLVNNSYKLAKFQRQAGIDSRLRLQSHQLDTGDDPAWEDRSLAGNYPDWIEIAPVNANPFKRHLKHAFNLVARRISPIDGIDVLHAQSGAPLLGQFQAPDRLVSHCLGSDLRELAFSRGVLGYLMRCALRRSRIIFFNNIDHVDYLDRLKMSGVFLPNPLDLDRYRPRPRTRRFPDHDFVVFHPVRLDWTYRGSKRSSIKGNDRLFRAFARFLRQEPKALLVCLRSGPDVVTTATLADELGIKQNVVFLDRLRKDALQDLLDASDLVADQFALGALGGVAIEALACGRPLLTYLDEDAARRCYGALPPIFNAYSEDNIFDALLVARDADLRARGEQGRVWAERHHDWRKVVDGVARSYAEAGLVPQGAALAKLNTA